MNNQLAVGVILKAKDPCTMNDTDRDALVVGNEYPIEKLSTKSLWVRSNEYDLHEFDLGDTAANWQHFFEIATQGIKIDLPKFVDEVKLSIPDGFTIDVDNSNLAEGIIKYKKVKPKRPMSMGDLGNIFSGWYINNYNELTELGNPENNKINYNTWPSKEWAESIQAQCKLVRLRDAWNEGWKPDWTNNLYKFAIILDKNKPCTHRVSEYSEFLTFESRQISDDFLETFRDLIETYFKPYKS